MNTTILFYLLWNVHILLESLPISSSSHVALINNFIGRLHKQAPLSLSRTTNYLMHIPTLFVVGAFLATNTSKWILPDKFITLGLAILSANGITVACFHILNKVKIKDSFFVGLSITSLVLLSLFRAPSGSTLTPDLLKACLIGFAQGIALLPGISRLAITYAVGIWLALTPQAAFLFSLFLEFFLILGAVMLALYEQWGKKSNQFSACTWYGAVSVVTSVGISYALLEWVFRCALTGKIAYFGFYTFAVALLALIPTLTRTQKKSGV